MIEMKQYRIDKEKLRELPLFYGFILQNEVIDIDNYFIPHFNKEKGRYIPFEKPEKLISKIVDFSLIDLRQ